jgi:UDP-galactopyranose mutase
MALLFSEHLIWDASAVAYDCMDELSLFKGADPRLLTYEAKLFRYADVVYTGGYSLYEHKRSSHRNIHPVPSSIDYGHFVKARQPQASEPKDQASIPNPRLGFYGVIDERLDLGLIRGIAQARPSWHIVLVGPVVKVNPADLPVLPNIHYLGKKEYEELPTYLAGWDVAILPFANCAATRFISPTKTPEYLAGGKPVVSTSIRDVVHPYGEKRLAYIADTVNAFVQSLEVAMDPALRDRKWLATVDRFLAGNSWDKTWRKMASLLNPSSTSEASQAQRGAAPYGQAENHRTS